MVGEEEVVDAVPVDVGDAGTAVMGGGGGGKTDGDGNVFEFGEGG